MEHSQGPKTPLQIRLDAGELAVLDTYIARFPEFPPSRVDVVRKALMEWLAQKREPALTVQTPQPSRAVPEPPPTLLVPGAAEGQALPGPSPEDIHRERRRAQVVATIPWEQENPGGISPADMRRTIGFGKPEVANDLRTLMQGGQIQKVGAGLYVRRVPQRKAIGTEGSA